MIFVHFYPKILEKIVHPQTTGISFEDRNIFIIPIIYSTIIEKGRVYWSYLKLWTEFDFWRNEYSKSKVYCLYYFK